MSDGLLPGRTNGICCAAELLRRLVRMGHYLGLRSLSDAVPTRSGGIDHVTILKCATCSGPTHRLQRQQHRLRPYATE